MEYWSNFQVYEEPHFKFKKFYGLGLIRSNLMHNFKYGEIFHGLHFELIWNSMAHLSKSEIIEERYFKAKNEMD